MYIPSFNEIDDIEQIRAMVAAQGAANLVSADGGSHPVATLLPIIWHGDTVIAHMARANPHWRTLDGASVLLICSGPQAYISPSWYPAKAEHGRVVPTWNYSAVHLSGTARVHHDKTWLRRAVEALTDIHEAVRAEPWHVTDAPASYIDSQLNGIIGIEVQVQRVEAKAKLSQNRSVADRAGVIAGLGAQPDPEPLTVARAMAAGLDRSVGGGQGTADVGMA